MWLWAKPTSDGLNASVDFVLALVDSVRRIPPSAREDNLRRWGPFQDDKHPGREIQIVMTRWFPYGDDARPAHAYRFEARVAGTPGFDPILIGTFEGASASRGRGGLSLDFDRMWALQMTDPSAPHGVLRIAYDRAGDPVTIDLSLAQQGFGVEQFDYGYAGYRDRSGRFDYRVRTATNDVLTVITGFDAGGAGRARVAFLAAGGGTGSFDECWDGSACLTWLDDPSGFVCGAPGCTRGGVAACVAVKPPAPF